MKNLTIILCSIIAIFVFSCNSPKKDVKELANKFADLEGRAITLRKSRFELANQIRFTQDTLLQLASSENKSRIELQLAYYNKEKDILLKQSLSLADTIHNQLSNLMTNELTSAHDKEVFNQVLNNKLQQQEYTEK